MIIRALRTHCETRQRTQREISPCGLAASRVGGARPFRLRLSAAAVAVVAMFALQSAQTPLCAQTKSAEKSDKSKAEQPLELPEFVITGVEALDVPGGAKQAPKIPAKLSSEELRRLNPLDKQSFTLLPASPAPLPILPRNQYRGFAQGEFGMFITPSLQAGYGAALGNFDLYAKGGLTVSNGHLPFADFFDAHLSLESSYLAPEKFFFFGGSRTDSYLRFHRRAYNFFGADALAAGDNPPSRLSSALSAGVRSEGAFENLSYSMGADIDGVALDDNLENAALNAQLSLHVPVQNFRIGGKADIHAQFVRDESASAFGHPLRLAPSALVVYANAHAQCSAELGAHIVRQGGENLEIYPSALVRASFVALERILHFRLNAMTGVRANSFMEVLRRNPYAAAPLRIRAAAPSEAYQFERVVFDGALSAVAHFSPFVSATLGVGGSLSDSAMAFQPTAQNGEIAPIFGSLRMLRGFTELHAEISPNDLVAARLEARSGAWLPAGAPSNAEFSSLVPYLSPLEASLRYRRTWFAQFSSALECVYNAPRFVGEGQALAEFVDIRARLEYRFLPNLQVYLRGDNLLNQNIALWRRYQERGIFIAAGVMFAL